MKKIGTFKMLFIGFFSSFISTLYITKFNSIIESTDLSTYAIYGFSIILFFLISSSIINYKIYIQTLFCNKYNLKTLSKKIYNFSKTYHGKDDFILKDYINNKCKNKQLKQFFSRYLDKNTPDELKTYLIKEQTINDENNRTIKEISIYNEIFIILSTLACYIYDSNIKGIILISLILAFSNIITYENLKNKLHLESKLILIFNNIYMDILDKSPVYIRYKIEELLNINIEDNIETKDFIGNETIRNIDEKVNNTIIIQENRKSKSLIIGKKRKLEENAKEKIAVQ